MSSVSLDKFIVRLSQDYVDAPCDLACMGTGSCPDSSDPSVCVFARDYVSFCDGAYAMFDVLLSGCKPDFVENTKLDDAKTGSVRLPVGMFDRVCFADDGCFLLSKDGE